MMVKSLMMLLAQVLVNCLKIGFDHYVGYHEFVK